jgi:diguanylate cyclase (GGDEF)-like protein
MSATVTRDLANGAATGTARRRHSIPVAIRLGIGLDRSMWPADRAIAEFRWAALTVGLMLAMALPAHLLSDPSGGYGRAALVSGVALAIIGALAWSPLAVPLSGMRAVRRATGPVVLVVALAAAGVGDPARLDAQVGTPFVVLAITFAALTPGFSIAAVILGLVSGSLFAQHAMLPGHDPFDTHGVDFVVRGSVALLAAGAMHAVDRGLRRERRRAEGLAARKVAKVDQLEGLQRIVGRFDGSRPVAEVMQDVVEDVATTFDVTLVSAYLPDETGRLSMVGVAGYDSPFHVIELGVGIIGRSAASRETVFSDDVLADPDYRAARPDVRSEVAVPVVHGDELLGILNFEGTAARPIGSTHVAVAEMLALQITGALRSARLDDERRQRLHAIERVLEVSRGLASDLDRRRLVTSVVDAARDLLQADAVEFISRGADGIYRVEHALGVAEPGRVGQPIGPGDGLVESVIRDGVRIVRTGEDSGQVGVGLPIHLEGVPSAVLAATRQRPDHPFSELELRMADLLVTQVEVALHNAELHARVSEAAVRDPLTGLLNRRYFDEAVETAFAAAARGDRELSLVVFDLDRFSEVNNVHGHAVGDAVLRRVARAMAAVIRTGDIVARYGGEEFVVIAPGATRDEAVQVAERVRAAVAAETARPIDGLDVPITVSAGVASRLGDEADGRALFRAADSALLAAKRAGRDRVVSV